jgi:fumarate reductase flavoprotein subunit
MTDGNKALIEAALAEEPVSDEHAALQKQVQEDYDAYLASGETGIFDSAAWYALQTWNGGDKVANLSLVQTMADNAFSAYEWLISLGGTFKDTISQGPGSLYPRTHDTETGLGAEFVDTYVNYLDANYPDQYTIYYGTEATELVLDDAGNCVAVKGEDKNNNTYTFTAENGIVLATGGFAGNVEMRVEYCQSEKWPDLGKNVGTTGVVSDTGDGILMAKAIGANLVDMDQIQLLHMCNPTNGTTDDNSAKDKGVSSIIFVNQEGNRFVAEDERRDTICLAVLQQTDAKFYAIESWDGNGDATLDELVTNNGVSYTDEIAKGNMFYGETLEDLAAAIGADPANLVAAVENYNASVDAGASSDEFGRKTFVEKLENGPFLAVPRKPSAHHTMGGVEINNDTQVIDTNGEVINGLFAAGEVTGGIHGGNRLGGNAIVDTVVMGKIAGENAAKNELK